MVEKENKNKYSVKLCYNCGTPLSMNAGKCYSCSHKVGEADRHGKARRPTDWIAYVVCIVAWAVFFAYIWWAFF